MIGGLEIDAVHHLDALSGLKKLPDESIDCVMTSPPYWALRDYNVKPIVWSGDADCEHSFFAGQDFSRNDYKQAGKTNKYTAAFNVIPTASEFCVNCGAWKGSLGLEPDLDQYVDHLLLIFDEIKRVLKPAGTAWINLSDTYAGSWGNYGQSLQTKQRWENGNGTSWRRGYSDATLRPPSSNKQPVPRRSLCQIPARFAIGMCDRGWILRNDIIWHKPNHMPASVKNRLCNSWEHLYFFVKMEKYYFDLDAIRVPHKSLEGKGVRPRPPSSRSSTHLLGVRMPPNPGQPQSMHPLGKNPGDFWTIPSETRTLGELTGQRGAVKVPGGQGWLGHAPGGQARIVREQDPRWLPPNGKNPGDAWDINTQPFPGAHFAVYPVALCEMPIQAGCPLGGIVLDPFVGSGTTAVVARKLGRRFIGFELNESYTAIARKRIESVAS